MLGAGGAPARDPAEGGRLAGSLPQAPGYIEVDMVAHCGGSMSGSFAWTLTMTDVATHWTELRTVWNKGAVAVCCGISDFIKRVPFEVLALNSDNGGECINGHIKRFEKQPKTPVQRVLEAPEVPEATKETVRAMIAAHDIIDLRERMNADLRLLARKLAAAPAGATPKGRPGCSASIPGTRPSASKPRLRKSDPEHEPRTIRKTA